MWHWIWAASRAEESGADIITWKVLDWLSGGSSQALRYCGQHVYANRCIVKQGIKLQRNNIWCRGCWSLQFSWRIMHYIINIKDKLMSKQDLFVLADKNSVEQHEWLICLNAVEQKFKRPRLKMWCIFCIYMHSD